MSGKLYTAVTDKYFLITGPAILTWRTLHLPILEIRFEALWDLEVAHSTTMTHVMLKPPQQLTSNKSNRHFLKDNSYYDCSCSLPSMFNLSRSSAIKKCKI